MLFPVSRQAEEVSGQLDQSRVKRLRLPRSHLAISPHGVTDTLHFLTKWSHGQNLKQLTDQTMRFTTLSKTPKPVRVDKL